MQLIALRSFRYGTRELRAGDVFDATPAIARFYAAVGRARACIDGLPATDAPITERALEAIDGKPRRTRRAYKRRDLRAED